MEAREGFSPNVPKALPGRKQKDRSSFEMLTEILVLSRAKPRRGNRAERLGASNDSQRLHFAASKVGHGVLPLRHRGRGDRDVKTPSSKLRQKFEFAFPELCRNR